MKKILFPIIVLALVSASSCTKVSSPTNYWSFNGIVYNVGTCTNSNGQIYVLNTDNTNSLTLTFAAGSSPVAPGTYTVLGGLGATPGVGQVSLSMTIGTSGQTYYSTIESVAEKVQVSAGSEGKVSVAGSVIWMMNKNNPSDSASVNFNCIQNQ